MGASDTALPLSTRDRKHLERWSRSRTLASRVVLRSRIVLMLADGHGVNTVTRVLKVAPATVRLWRRRVRERGAEALLQDAPGRGRKPVLDEATREALRVRHANGDQMTIRQRARELGVSAATVSRWRRRA